MQLKPKDERTDEDWIGIYGTQAERRNGRPVYLGHLKRPGWTGRIPTYLIFCRRCRATVTQGFTVAHLAGRQDRLECGYCRTRFDQRLTSRIIRDTLPNPHRHPRFICFLLLLAMLLGIYASQP